MSDICQYQLQIRGEMTESELNSRSPIQVAIIKNAKGRQTLSCTTDQSGLIGLIRQLHSLGFVLLTITRIDEQKPTRINQS